MALYNMSKILFDNEIDTIASKYSLQRINNESMDSYRDRIYHQTMNPISQNISDIGFYLNNCAGVTESPLFKVDLFKDSKGEPVHPFCYFNIDSYYFHIVENYFKPDKKISIPYRELDTFDELIDKINSYKMLVCSKLFNINTSIYKDTYSLKVQTNLHFGHNHYSGSTVRLGNQNIFEVFSDSTILTNEVDDFNKIKSVNDYFFDRKNGIIFLYAGDSEFLSGGFEYSYGKYPFYIKKQPIKISLGKDPSFLNMVKEDIEEKKGEIKKSVITSEGWNFYNALLNSSPIYWGH